MHESNKNDTGKPKRFRKKAILPGFGISLGFTMAYLGIIVLLPLSAAFVKAAGMSFQDFCETVFSPRVLAAYKLSFSLSFYAALTNSFFGLLVAWVLTRYTFPAKRFIDGIVDLPFALPTAVAGIALTAIYSPNGWLGQVFYKLGIPSAYSPFGIYIALTFIGLPFVVRTLQPIIEDIDPGVEEAAVVLGANSFQRFMRVILPGLMPALLTGFSLAFARGLGEYGSVVFISGNMPMKTEIAPLLIMTRLEEHNTEGATAIASVLLVISFILLLITNLLQRWTSVRGTEQ